MGGFLDMAIGRLGAAVPGPDHDFWYNPAGVVSSSGIVVTPEGAQKVSAFYRGVDLLSTALAMLPLHLFVRLPDDAGADLARTLALYDVLHRKPNRYQNSFVFRRMATRHLILKGNHYSRIIPGPRGTVDQLLPLSPNDVKPRLFRGEKVFDVRQADGRTQTLLQDEVFHLCGPSDDGVEGVGVVQWARDAIGLALATEGYAQRLFSQGSLYGTVVKWPSKPDDETRQAIKQSMRDATSGLGNAHQALVVWNGAEVTRVALSGEETQFIQSRKFSIDDIARWLGVPPHMIGSLERATFSNIEHQGQEFVTYSLGPWLTLWEQSINDQLLLTPETHYAEFQRDALVRGDIAARWAAYTQAVQTGTYTRNEVRRLENRKALPGLDEPLDPAHLTGRQAAAAEPPRDAPAPVVQPEPPSPRRRRAEQIAQAAAARVLRKEAAAIGRAAERHAADSDAFAAEVAEFYTKHQAFVAQVMLVDAELAAEWCRVQMAEALTDGAAAAERWQGDDYAAALVALALDIEETAA